MEKVSEEPHDVKLSTGIIITMIKSGRKISMECRPLFRMKE